MSVRRLSPGETYSSSTKGRRAAFVLLGDRCSVNWGEELPAPSASAKMFFDSLPYYLYLPTNHSATFQAGKLSAKKIAECRAPSEAKLQPKLITPKRRR